MSWIKDNQFNVVLGGGTLAGAVLLYFVGAHGTRKYQEAKDQFDASAAAAAGFENSPLYPTTPNRDSKRKALDEYGQAVGSMQVAFEPFRPKEIKNISPQEFTTELLSANAEVRKAFQDAGTKLPEAFFVGFESYKTSLAGKDTTGVLDYQLNSIKSILLALAKSRPSELKNLYRPAVQEEDRQTYTPPESAVARPFPLEITFVGPEKSVREFLSSITKPVNPYAVVRCLRITNEKKDPPRASDAQFDKPAAAKPAVGAAADPFGGFVLPAADDAAAGTDKSKPAPPAPKASDSSRILSQVLGNEQLRVFVRLDILEFLPAKKLP